MSLILPSSSPSEGPALHALVIGVGDYPHLRGGSGSKARNSYGLGQIKPPIDTTRAVLDWLLTRYRNPARPLGSIEFLLSPGGVIDTPVGPHEVLSATMANVVRGVSDWFARCHTHSENLAFFYFCGHGLSKTAQFLLPCDFGNPADLDDWENCVDFTKFRMGMRRCKAETQLFFIDACRDTPSDLLAAMNVQGKPLVSADFSDRVSTSAAYFASSEGNQAFGPAAGGVTFFGEAVLHCLDGAGTHNSDGFWAVDTFKMGDSIGRVLTHLFGHTGKELGHSPQPEGNNATIHFPEKPYVLVKLGCNPSSADLSATIVARRQSEVVRAESQLLEKQLHPGEWETEVTFADDRYRPFREVIPLMPPIYNRRVNVG